ncbi:SrfA family protein [Sodalis sp. RH21]|uniref:SrfA family protein n=1 Tax=unclassified Sodalis (in: enterobacteria) TaxID=2636512 RepID=UPI0039B40210
MTKGAFGVAKSFLRSGSLDDIFALGENGQPVYASALQIRETLRLRQQRQIAECLAIPQPNEAGDRIDWYSPIEGKVISWAMASLVQRTSALRELQRCQAAAAELSQRAQNAEKNARRLFGALLAKTIRFPDRNYVYLVGGKPVITFWGFVSPEHKTDADALACLQLMADEAGEDERFTALPADGDPPASSSVNITAPPPIADTVLDLAPESPVQARALPAAGITGRRRWRHAVWLAGILLLLFLALQIRDWVTGMASSPVAPLKALTPREPALPAIARNDSSQTDSAAAPVAAAKPNPPGANRPSTALIPAPSAMPLPAAAAQPVPADLPTAQPVSVAPAAAVNQMAADNSAPASPAITAAAAGETRNDGAGDAAAAIQPVPPAGKNALSLSAEAVKQGSTDFLNGNWRAIPEIKDPLTGKPPSLRYQLNHGQGTVKITYGDGITCRASAGAGLMKSGNLVINSRNKARCSDGSRYQMPEIICKQGANGTAECQGRYNAATAFPMTIKREKE